MPPAGGGVQRGPDTGTASLTVQFNDTSSGAITSRAWTIGNDTISGSAVPLSFTWVFEEPGTYTATLTVNGPGGTDTASKQITVTAPTRGASAGFTRSGTGGGASFPALTTRATFTGQSVDAEDGNSSDLALELEHRRRHRRRRMITLSNALRRQPHVHRLRHRQQPVDGHRGRSRSRSTRFRRLRSPTRPAVAPAIRAGRGASRDPGDGPPDRRR